jgi:hypothetical protein
MKIIEAKNRIRDLSYRNEVEGCYEHLKLDHPISISWGNLREWGGGGGGGVPKWDRGRQIKTGFTWVFSSSKRKKMHDFRGQEGGTISI